MRFPAATFAARRDLFSGIRAQAGLTGDLNVTVRPHLDTGSLKAYLRQTHTNVHNFIVCHREPRWESSPRPAPLAPQPKIFRVPPVHSGVLASQTRSSLNPLVRSGPVP